MLSIFYYIMVNMVILYLKIRQWYTWIKIGNATFENSSIERNSVEEIVWFIDNLSIQMSLALRISDRELRSRIAQALGKAIGSPALTDWLFDVYPSLGSDERNHCYFCSRLSTLMFSYFFHWIFDDLKKNFGPKYCFCIFHWLSILTHTLIQSLRGMCEQIGVGIDANQIKHQCRRHRGCATDSNRTVECEERRE